MFGFQQDSRFVSGSDNLGPTISLGRQTLGQAAIFPRRKLLILLIISDARDGRMRVVPAQGCPCGCRLLFVFSDHTSVRELFLCVRFPVGERALPSVEREEEYYRSGKEMESSSLAQVRFEVCLTGPLSPFFFRLSLHLAISGEPSLRLLSRFSLRPLSFFLLPLSFPLAPFPPLPALPHFFCGRDLLAAKIPANWADTRQALSSVPAFFVDRGDGHFRSRKFDAGDTHLAVWDARDLPSMYSVV